MIEAIATRSVLMRQESVGDGKKKDILTQRGKKMKITEEDAIKFYGAFKFSDADSKKLLAISKRDKIKRVI